MKFLAVLFMVAMLVAIACVLLDARKKLRQRLGFSLGLNTITNLIPTLYEALDVVSRELVGFIPAVSRDSGAERAAVGQTVNVFVAPPATTSNITPGTNAPDDGDQTIGNVPVTISKSKYAPVRWAGEEQKAVSGSGQMRAVLRDQFVQAMRALVNEVEVDLGLEAYKNASRSFGTPGTAPFGTANDLSDSAQLFKILDDNGAPKTGRQLVLGTSAMVNIRGKQTVLFKVNESGTEQLLRDGIIGRLQGFDLRDSAGVATHTKGTAAGSTTNNAGYAIGATTITLAAVGTGTIVAGDSITFAGDTNKYVVISGDADVSNGGTITIGAPGLRVAIPAANTAITVGNAGAQNIGFTRNALVLATRAPAMPDGGDAASDVFELTDPNSGLSFQIAVYKQYRRVKFEVGLAWGWKAIKQEHIAVLLG